MYLVLRKVIYFSLLKKLCLRKITRRCDAIGLVALLTGYRGVDMKALDSASIIGVRKMGGGDTWDLLRDTSYQRQ